MKTRHSAPPCGNPLLTVYKVIEGFFVMLLEISIEMHISPDAKFETIGLLDCRNVGIAAFFTQRSFLITRTISSHTRGIIVVSHMFSLALPRQVA